MSVESARLAAEWDRYHELFSWAPLGYARLTFTGRVREMNYTGADLLEVTTTDVVGHPLAAYVARADRAAFVAHLDKARRSSETIDEELHLRSAGGHTFPVWMCTRRSPLRDQESCWTIFADLTEHHRRSEAQGTTARDRFVATLSHELRTPLTPVLLATSLLCAVEGLPGSVARIVETIRRNVEREARLIDDLLGLFGPGRGSALELPLPLLAMQEPGSPASTTHDGDAPTRPAGRVSLRILVVEDHTDSGAMLDLMLTSRGHTVAVASSVAGALARSQEPWDVVISDLGLPDGSGLEIGRVMRALPQPPRLIALSGYGRPADVAASHEAGFDIHLVKPLDPDRLFEILEAGA